MIYYRIKPEFDNKILLSRYIYVGGELFTEKETTRFKVNMDFCEKVEEKPKNTYFLFGARFSPNFKRQVK